MTLILSGTDGLSDIDGSAATPAIRGTDANTGIFFGADIIGFAEGGAEVARFDSSGNLLVGTTSAATPSTTGYISVANTFGFKNRLINSAMVIDQRNAGASVTFNDETFPVDRFRGHCTQSSKLTAQRSTTAPAGFINSLLLTSSSAYSVGAGDIFMLGQAIEGFNVSDLGWGTASAATVTLSFWVRSSLTGTFGGALRNSAGNRAYPFTYTISVANTFEYKTVTVVGDTSGTWLTDNGVGIRLVFSLGAGSTYSGTAGAWAGSNFWSATGATSVVGTNGATFYITGVQLEKGSTATSFDYRPYGTELALCQRYAQVRKGGEGSNSAVTFCGVGNARSASTWYGSDKFSVTMRTFPSLTVTNPTSFALFNTSSITTTGLGYDISDRDYMLTSCSVASGLTSSQFYTLTTNNSNALLVYSAEL